MRTGLQVIQEIQDRLGDRQAETIEGDVDKKVRKLLRLLNRVLKNLVSAEQWPMLRTEGTLVTNAPIEEDVLVDLTNGSNVVTLSSFDTSSVTFAANYVQWGIQFGKDTPIYRIDEVVSPTQIKLNRPWLGDTVTPASADDDTVALVLAMDRYALPEDFDRPTGAWQDFLSAYNIKPLGPQEFAEMRNRRGRNIDTDNPLYYTIYGLDPSNTYQVLHLEPWPSQQTMMSYDYQREHPEVEFDTDQILFPNSQLSIIIEAVIYLANRDYKDDQRMGAALTEYLQQYNAARSQQRVTSDHKAFTPWMKNRARSVRQSRGGVRIDYGDYFDVAGNTELD